MELGKPQSEYDLLVDVASECLSVMRLALKSGTLQQEDVERCARKFNEAVITKPEDRLNE